MSKIIVSGLINIETTLKVKGFPLEYYPVGYPFFGIESSVSGVGINIVKALSTLGDNVLLASLVGKDREAKNVIETMKENKLNTEYVIKKMEKTPQSAILYEESGRRQIHCDLKEIQDLNYPEDLVEGLLKDCKLAVLSTINFSRSFIKKAKEKDILIATDLHVFSDLDSEYHQDFLINADIVFLSDEEALEDYEELVKKIYKRYKTKVIVMSRGEKGAMLYLGNEDKLSFYKAVKTRKIVNTIGAGDALFSAFLHYYIKGDKEEEAVKKAIAFASYKIGEKGAADGFLSEKELEKLYNEKKEEF